MDFGSKNLIETQVSSISIKAMDKPITREPIFMQSYTQAKIPEDTSNIKIIVSSKTESDKIIETGLMNVGQDNIKIYGEKMKLDFDSEYSQYLSVTNVEILDDSVTTSKFLFIRFSYSFYEDKEFDIKIEFYS